MYADQSRASLDRERTVYDAVSEGNEEINLGGRSVRSRAYLSWFNFRGSDQQKPVSALSGGELNRLALAQVTKGGGNLLLGGKSLCNRINAHYCTVAILYNITVCVPMGHQKKRTKI